MTVFASENKGSQNDFRLENITVEPESNLAGNIKGQNYGFNVGDSSENVYGRVSGTAIFDYDGNKATVFSAGTPTVDKQDPNCTITASASGSQDGSNAVVTVSVTMKKLVFSNTMTVKIKCTAGGFITIE